MVMARVRYCEDCTVTIWVPGTGEQGVAGVTIAARDTLRWSLSMLILECFVSYNCVGGHCFIKTSTCSQAESESNPTASLFRDPRLGCGGQWRSGKEKSSPRFYLFICLHF